jgi:hypothetical protein
VVVQSNCQGEVVEGCRWRFRLRVDVSKSPDPNNRLGSFTGKLTWDPSQLEPADSTALLNNYTGVINLDTVASTLSFNGINNQGRTGVVDIFTTDFIVKASAGEKIKLQVDIPVMAAALTFADLRPNLLVEVCEPTVIAGGGLLGDVNEDKAVNSTDALIVLSYDAGLSVPPPVLARINQRFGDANIDNSTNSTDALVILSYELNPPSPYPVGVPYCPGDTRTRLAQAVKYRSAAVNISALSTLPGRDETLIDVPLIVDMAPTGEALGSFTADLRWNTQSLELLGYEGGTSPGFAKPVVNTEKRAQGQLTVASASPGGSPGSVHIFTLHFRQRKPLKEQDLALNFRSLATAHTFRNLRPQLSIRLSLPKQELSHDLMVAPNPFTQATTVHYQVKAPTQVEISVYNAAGVKVATLVKDQVPAGHHTLNWDTSSSNLPPGLYMLKMQSGLFNRTQKVIFIK